MTTHPGAAAAEVESLGYSALWSSAGLDAGVPDRFGRVPAATHRVPVASGILSIWHATPAEAAAAASALDLDHPGRFVLGLGASHAPLVEPLGDHYSRPYSRMVGYLDELDDLGPSAAADRRVLGRPRAPDADPGGRAGGRGPPLLRPDGARGPGPSDRGVPRRCWRRSWPWYSRPTADTRAVARGYTVNYLGPPN